MRMWIFTFIGVSSDVCRELFGAQMTFPFVCDLACLELSRPAAAYGSLLQKCRRCSALCWMLQLGLSSGHRRFQDLTLMYPGSRGSEEPQGFHRLVLYMLQIFVFKSLFLLKHCWVFSLGRTVRRNKILKINFFPVRVLEWEKNVSKQMEEECHSSIYRERESSGASTY